MKKYKLIKEYPGSPKLGTFIENFEINPKYYRVSGDVVNLFTKNIENHPEFWEEIIEKDYEILTYIDKESMLIYEVGGYGGKVKYTEDLVSKYFKIHSVKRLSDGSVFTIGDKIDDIIKYRFYTITEIKLVNEEIQLWTGCKAYYTLLSCKKVKQPLLRTEDGVDIYLGDETWAVHKSTWYLSPEPIKHNNQHWFQSGEAAHWSFSTKESAEEYILMNKPCLSLNDLLKCEEECRGNQTFEGSPMSIRFKELVKSKL